MPVSTRVAKHANSIGLDYQKETNHQLTAYVITLCRVIRAINHSKWLEFRADLQLDSISCENERRISWEGAVLRFYMNWYWVGRGYGSPFGTIYSLR